MLTSYSYSMVSPVFTTHELLRQGLIILLDGLSGLGRLDVVGSLGHSLLFHPSFSRNSRISRPPVIQELDNYSTQAENTFRPLKLLPKYVNSNRAALVPANALLISQRILYYVKTLRSHCSYLLFTSIGRHCIVLLIKDLLDLLCNINSTPTILLFTHRSSLAIFNDLLSIFLSCGAKLEIHVSNSGGRLLAHIYSQFSSLITVNSHLFI